jgi:hypothetical protein
VTLPLPNTPEWEDWRGGPGNPKGFGASIVHRAWRDPLSVYLYLRDGVPFHDEPKADERFRRWGHRLEPAIIEELCAEHGWYFSRPLSLEHPTKPWHRASLDTLVMSAPWESVYLARGDLASLDLTAILGPLDAKNRAFGWKDFGRDGETAEAGTCPPSIRLQVMAQTYVVNAAFGLELRQGWAGVSVGGQPPRLLEVPYDRELYEGEVVPHLDDLWRRILEGDPPEPVNYAGAAARWPQAAEEDEPLDLDAAAAELAAEYHALKEDQRAVADSLEAVKTKLCALLGDRPRGEAGDWRIAWSNVAGRERIDAALLRERYPDIYEQMVRVGRGHRAFRITRSKLR